MRMPWMCVAVTLLAACRSAPSTTGAATIDAATTARAASAAATGPGAATVVRVVDGDTIVVRIGSRRETVRLIGVDTPETVKPNTPVQCWGHEASADESALLPPGTAVRLERDVEARDAYGRLLAYVYRASDGMFVNLELARRGDARVLTFPTNTAHTTEIVAAALDAERTDRGLWHACRS
jgi:micrococcal nuclease